MREYKKNIFWFVWPLLLILCMITCCTGRKNSIIDLNQDTTVARVDSNLLFDGRTLNGWKITNFGPQGPVYVSGGEMILGMGDGCTGITWQKDFPADNYIVNLEAKRVAGNDFFCGLTFPVGKAPCTLIVGGWGGTVVGLSSINNLDASENETTTLIKFQKDIWYRISLKVANDSIKVFIDDQIVVDFAVGDNKISIRPEVELSKPFGISSWYTTAAIRNIRLKKL